MLWAWAILVVRDASLLPSSVGPLWAERLLQQGLSEVAPQPGLHRQSVSSQTYQVASAGY